MSDKALRAARAALGIAGGASAQLSQITQELKGSEVNISIIGDSLVGIGAGSATPLGTLLSALDENITVTTFTNPAKDGEYIANSVGACGLYVQPVTIPATGGVVITIKNSTDTTIDFANLSPTAFNPIYINGISGNLSFSSPNLTFTRITAGAETVLSRPAKLITNYAKNHITDICILWIGTNNASIADSEDPVFYLIQDVINMLPHKKYIILPVITKSKFANVATLQVYYKRVFGSKFLNIYQYLLSYGLADAGITATEQDTTDIAAGEIPVSLRDDATHLNTAGNTVLANLIHKTLEELNYLA